ncbi:zinc-ribbon domain-containing protein [uncultured Croceitalea sp.]|uniref:zinc-ribbon domain-containing protein n=1 Tax=uncultured Croceitalea sp. TaxID=1798908 RepID=UPI0033057C65
MNFKRTIELSNVSINMILFFGTKSGKPIIKKLRGVSCSYCRQQDTLTAKVQPNYFHLFWIPLFKIGTSRFAECSHCRRAFYKEEFSEEMMRQID